MNLKFSDEEIDSAIRKNSRSSSMILDLKNTASWIPDEKLFYARENKNKIELARIKTPFTALLPTIIIIFKKDDLQKPRLRLSFFGYLLFSLLLIMVLYILLKKVFDDFEGDIFSATFILLFFLSLLFCEFLLTKKTYNKLERRMFSNKTS
ncbi:MAG: hypothetical protein ITF99_06260 [Chryseobacterium sp.]|nr:hypothetical protein [Chryseobacterium sp.]